MLDGLHMPTHLGPHQADHARSLAFIEGTFVPLHDARLPVRDFGFTHADATYDVVHTWRGAFFRLEDHLDRFEHSCRGMRLHPGLDRAAITGTLCELVRRAGLPNTLVWFACTRGAPPPGSRDPALCTNTFMAHCQPLVLRASPDQAARGLSMLVHERVHRIPPSAVDPTCKNQHWGDFTRALFDAQDQGFDTVVLTSDTGHVTEGPGFNVMALIDGELRSPDHGVLEGVSRLTMMELASELGLPARLAPITPEELRDADEAFITSTSCGLVPVTRIDGRVLGNGAPGPVTTRLLNRYYQRKDEGWHMTPIPGFVAA